MSPPPSRGIPVDRLPPSLREAVRLAPGRPDLAGGIRAAAATVVPLAVGGMLLLPDLFWAGLAGFATTLSDKGGMYRTRAAGMGAVALGSLLAVALGTLVGDRPLLAVGVMLAWGLLAGMAGAYGPTATSVGTLTSVILVIALAHPGGGDEVRHRLALVLAGGLWALLLGLFLWPIRPYRPARLAVSRCYRAIAEFAASLAAGAEEGEAEGTQPQDFGRVRAELEVARAALAAVRRGRLGESPRGERLVVLLESAEQMLGLLVGLGDVLDSLSLHPALGEERARVEGAVRGFADTARRVAEVTLQERGAPGVPPPRWGPGAPAAPDDPAGRTGILRLEYAARMLRALHGYAQAAAEAASGLNQGQPAEAAPGSIVEFEPRRPLLEPIRANLTTDSALFRHALRVAVTSALAVALTGGLRLERGYWVTITVVIILQPYTGITLVKGVQRVAGTVLGGVIAAGIAALVHDPWGILAVMLVLATVSVSLLPLNYALYSVFLTPCFVLLAELNAGDWDLAGVRILNTLLGGALALAAARLLWSVPERERFPGHLAEALRAGRDYLEAAVALLAGASAPAPAPAPGALPALRRRLGLAILNAEQSLQRLLTESVRGAELEPALAVPTYLRRLAAAVIALAAAPPVGPGDREALRRAGEAAGRFLVELEGAVREGRPPAVAEPQIPADALPPLLRAQMERVARTLRVLASTLARLPRDEGDGAGA